MPKYETFDAPKTYETFDVPVVGESQTAPQGAQRGAPTSEEARANAKEFALSSLPALGAAGAVALTAASGGTATPLTAPVIAALVGGFTGKGVEMGMRTGTGVGAETVPPTTGGRLMAGLQSGVEQAGYEALPLTVIQGMSRMRAAAAPWALETPLGQAIVKGRQEKITYEGMRSANAETARRLDERLAAIEAARDVKTGKVSAKLEAEQKALTAKREAIQKQSLEETFRQGHIVAAHDSVDRALKAENIGIPGAGMTDLGMQKVMNPLGFTFEKDLLENMGAEYVGLERAAASRATAPVDARPIFKRAVDAINRMPEMKGTGGIFTEKHKTLAALRDRFSEFGKGKAAVVSPGDPNMLTAERRVSEAVDAVDKNESLGGLLVMRGGLAQEIAKARALKDQRVLDVLTPLAKDTDDLIKATMGKAGWKEGPAALDAANAAWREGKSFMEHQAYQLLRKSPERAHELLDAASGYTPILKRVLKETGGYDQMWPEIRRRWIESNFMKNGKFDASGFNAAARENQAIMGEIFDTPAAKEHLRRLHLASGRIDGLQNGAIRGVADYTKVEKFNQTLQEIGEELATMEKRAEDRIETIMASSGNREDRVRELISRARGAEKEAIEDAWAKAQERTKLAIKEASGIRLRQVPGMLVSRGTAGAAMGFASGQGVTGAAIGAAIGAGSKYGEDALVKYLVRKTEDPVYYARLMDSMNKWDKAIAPNVAQTVRLGILGYQGGGVLRDLALAPSH